MARKKIYSTAKGQAGTNKLLQSVGLVGTKKTIDKINKINARILKMNLRLKRAELRNKNQEYVQRQYSQIEQRELFKQNPRTYQARIFRQAQRIQQQQQQEQRFQPQQELSPEMEQNLQRIRALQQRRLTRLRQTSPQAIDEYRRRLRAIQDFDREQFNLLKSNQANHQVKMNWFNFNEAQDQARTINIMKEREDSINILKPSERGTILNAPRLRF